MLGGLAALAFVAIGDVGDAHAGPRPAGQVQGIAVSEVAGETSIKIRTSAKPTFTTYKLDRPSRVVIEVSGARLGDVEVPFDANTFAVGAVAASVNEDEEGARTRIVVGLRRASDYQVRAEADGIVVRVQPHERAAPALAGRAPEVERMKRDAEAEARRLDGEKAKHASAARQLAEERDALEANRREQARARAEIESRTASLAIAQAEVERARREADEIRLRAEGAEQRAERARRDEEERGNAFRDASAEVEARTRQLEAKLAALELQRRKLDEAARRIDERERAVQAASAELAAREQEVAEAAGRLERLRSGDASSAQSRAVAEAALARAERERQQAAEAASRSRKDLAIAVADRHKQEEARRAIENERALELRRLKLATEQRAAEEARRAGAEAARRSEEERLLAAQVNRRKADEERARLEAEKASLAATVERLRQEVWTAERAKSTAARASLPPPVAASSPAGASASGASAPTARPRSVTLRLPSRVQRIDFVDEPTRSSVIIDLDEPSLFAVERVGGRRLTLRLLHADLPRGLERTLDATDFLGPVRVISSYREPTERIVRVDVELAEDVPNTVRQDGARLYWDFSKAALPARAAAAPARPGLATRARSLDGRAIFIPAPRVAAFQAGPLATSFAQVAGGTSSRMPAKKRFVGRRIDLDFKDADLHNILRLLSDVGGVNIVTSDDVRGAVTIKMKDVPWDQALDVVLRSKMLGQVREGNLIRVAPLQVLEKELEQEIARQKQITDVLPTETRLIGVSYASAPDLVDRAKDVLSPRGRISVDQRTNTLIVSDVAKNLALIEELVRNLDTQTSQVVIEARIVEARSTFVRQLGVQWGGTAFADQAHGNPTGLAFPFNVGVGGGATDGQTPTGGLVPGPRSGTGAADPNFAVNLPVAAGTGAGGALGVTLGSVAGAFNLNLRLSALESSGQVRILSSPRVSTMDNHEATIEQGVSIPISVVSAQGVNTVFVDAKLNLTVKPHVTNDGTILMDVVVTRNEPDFVNTGARGDPTISKKQAKTMMLVRDGDTAVIGGIYQRNSGLSYAKVPFLADLPVLGALFRNRRENDDRTEFLVFITPRVANRARALGN